MSELVKTVAFKGDETVLPKLPDPGRNLFSSPEWMRVIYRTYGTSIFLKYIEREGKVASYIFYTVVNNFLEWKICVASYCDYCDGFVERPEDWQTFFEAFRQEFPRYRIAIRNLRDDHLRQNPNFKVLSQEWFHLLNLKDDLDVLWQRIDGAWRNKVKIGQRNKITVRVGDKKHLKEFYNLHVLLRKQKFGIFAQPYRFFDVVWEEYMAQNKGVLLGAFDEAGRMIAANIYLQCGRTFYYKFSTSRLKSIHLRPNNLLFWEGIKLAKERGMDFMDLGSSGLEQEGLISFKSHAGAQKQYITHMGFSPENYKYSQKRILKIFTKTCNLPWMPTWVSKVGSDIIYPYLA